MAEERIKLEVGRLYEAEDGTFGLCTQSDGVNFGLSFVAADIVPRVPMLYRIYKEDGTGPSLPRIVKKLCELPSPRDSIPRSPLGAPLTEPKP